jgi:hypothetical protein
MKRITIALTAAVLAAACSDSTGPAAESGVSLSFTSGGAGAAAAPGAFFSIMSDTLSDGQSNVLILDKVEVVLREIELKRQSAPGCDDLPDDDDCEKFETGPVLVDVPLNGQTETAVTISPDPDTYDELEFDIHKVSNDDPEDAAFRAAHPDMVGKSIRVMGSYNGQPFTYETDLDVEQEFDLSPPIVVTSETTSTNVTVLLGVDQWFRDGSGDLVNPQDGNKGGQHESLVKENIKQSIEAFEDEDHDGHDDLDDDS